MSQTMNLRWDGAYYSEEADRNFRKTLAAVGVPFFVLSILMRARIALDDAAFADIQRGDDALTDHQTLSSLFRVAVRLARVTF